MTKIGQYDEQLRCEVREKCRTKAGQILRDLTQEKWTVAETKAIFEWVIFCVEHTSVIGAKTINESKETP